MIDFKPYQVKDAAKFDKLAAIYFLIVKTSGHINLAIRPKREDFIALLSASLVGQACRVIKQ